MLLKDKSFKWYIHGIGVQKWFIPIYKDLFRIGRTLDCELSFASTSISRQHARITIKDKKIFIEDLKSKNGTYVNNKKIKNEIEIKNGDVIKIGSIGMSILFKDPDRVTKKTNIGDSIIEINNKNYIEKYKFTKKEIDIIPFVLKGETAPAIAKKLKITAGTAKNHILSIYKKTGVHSKVEFVNLFNKLNK